MLKPPAAPALTAIVLGASLLLAGCAGPSVIDSSVQSYSALDSVTAVSGQSYRFERLPLSRANAAGEANLERWTANELARFGLVSAATNAAARYTVQVNAGVTRYDSLPPAGGFWPGWRFGIGFGVGGYSGFGGWGASPFIGAGFDNYLAPTPRYRREYEIVLRHAADNAVVYQSRAFNDSGWWNDEVVLPALVQAALQGFPTPPAVPRVVQIPLRDPARRSD